METKRTEISIDERAEVLEKLRKFLSFDSPTAIYALLDHVVALIETERAEAFQLGKGWAASIPETPVRPQAEAEADLAGALSRIRTGDAQLTRQSLVIRGQMRAIAKMQQAIAQRDAIVSNAQHGPHTPQEWMVGRSASCTCWKAKYEAVKGALS